jgi:DNA replication protein DnaC
LAPASIERERRMVERRIKAAKFPTVKSLDSFDFVAVPSFNKALVMELARSEYGNPPSTATRRRGARRITHHKANASATFTSR